MKRIIVCALSVLLALGIFAGCGGQDNQKGDATKVVIYRATGSLAGPDEEEVQKAIEEKYYEDTGNYLELEVHVMSQDGFYGKVDRDLLAGNQVDVITSHLGGGGGTLDNWVFSSDNRYLDISDLLEEYGQNIIEAVGREALFRMRTSDGDIFGIPDYMDPYKYGILVRKDWMLEAGYTDDESEVDADTKLLVTLDEFYDMLVKMRQNKTFDEAPYILAAQPWDLGRVITPGAYGSIAAGGFEVEYDENGEVETLVPQYASKSYRELVTFYSKLIEGAVPKDGTEKKTLWIKDSNNLSAEAKIQQDFVAGKAGVFIGFPTYDKLVKTARLTINQNPELTEDDFTVIGSLKGANGEDYGFIQDDIAFSGAVFTANTERAADVIKYLNWVYSSAENYDLCTLGIEGKHWVAVGEDGYKYPDDKEEEYLLTPPYSGSYVILQNDRISNRTYMDYSERELEWVETCRTNKLVKAPTYGLLMPTAYGDVAIELQDIEETSGAITSSLYTGTLKCVPWGRNYYTVYDEVTYNGEKMNVLDAFSLKAREDTSNYIEWVTAQYKILITAREEYIASYAE